MDNLEISEEEKIRLTRLAREVDKKLKEILEERGVFYIEAGARIYNVRSVGVQGDGRTYSYPAEITLFRQKGFVYNPELLTELSTRITNEIEGVNRVVIVIVRKEDR